MDIRFNKIRVFGVASMFALQIETVSSRGFFDTPLRNRRTLAWAGTASKYYGNKHSELATELGHIFINSSLILFVYFTPTLTQLSQ